MQVKELLLARAHTLFELLGLIFSFLKGSDPNIFCSAFLSVDAAGAPPQLVNFTETLLLALVVFGNPSMKLLGHRLPEEGFCSLVGW